MEDLAIFGGKPVRDQLLPYGHQSIDEDDINAVIEVLRTDWITQGPVITAFENKVADYCGTKYAVAVASGTAALHAACAVAGIGKGTEAIVTPLTFAATANAVVYCGGTPVFADIQPDSLNIDPQAIAEKITTKTKVILPVDFAGLPADIDKINRLAKEHECIVIEDACHALGAEYKGKKTGSQSDMTILSFHPVKHITTGEGGMILTNNEDFYEQLRVFRHHGIRKDEKKGGWYYEIHKPGYNFRITDIQCAIGLNQMNRIDSFLKARRTIAETYDKAFFDMPEIITPKTGIDSRHAYHIYVIQLETGSLTSGRKEIFDALRAENIGVNVHYMPLHLHPFYMNEFGYRPGDFPVAENYYERAITLPVHPQMSPEDTNDVIKAVKKVISCYKK